MAPPSATFSIYIDPPISEKPEKSPLSTPGFTPLEKLRVEIAKQTNLDKWLREPLREVAPNFARPTDPAWTLARLPDKKVTLGSLKKWQKKQPNDHTSKLLLFLYSLSPFYSILSSIYYSISFRDILILFLAPWPADESTAHANIDSLLLRPDQNPDLIEGKTVNELLQEIPDYQPIIVLPRPGIPTNIDTTKEWTPLGLFLLFWTPELLQKICNETNSYGYREQLAKIAEKPKTKPWKPISKLELLQFIGTCFLLGLHRSPPSKYFYSQKTGYLAGCPISKNRREAILEMLHFKDRGEGPHAKKPYWDKYGEIQSYLRQKSQYYWLPGSRVTVDKIMIRFKGRLSDITTIPGKPVPTGFKYFALADSSYILDHECTAPGRLEGELNEILSNRVISIPEKGIETKLSNT